MKRVLTFLALMLLPLSVMAMTPVSDSNLSDVTGQAGVNINADLTMSIDIGTMAWGDADGINSAFNPWPLETTAGYVGVTGFNINTLVIQARYDSGDRFNHYSTLFLKPITIDVATGDKSAAGGTGTTTFVRIGLGALKISLSQMSFNVALGDTRSANGLDQRLGVVTLAPMSIYINPWSYVDVFAHGGSGVTFDMAVTIDELTMNAMSWGDTDGYTTTNRWMNGTISGGYVGLNNFRIAANSADVTDGAISVFGAVNIDVATATHGIYPDLAYLFSAFATATGGHHMSSEAEVITALSAYPITPDMTLQQIISYLGTYVNTFFNYNNVTPVTTVRISFPSTNGLNIHVGEITGNVALGSSALLPTGSAQVGILGDIYIQGIDVNIATGSWVDIWAH